MTFEALVTMVVVGLVAGRLVGRVIKGGGHGLVGDLSLGVGGSIVGNWIFQVLGGAPGAGWVATLVVAFVGAAGALLAQRKIWPAQA